MPEYVAELRKAIETYTPLLQKMSAEAVAHLQHHLRQIKVN